jgi:hypothetical protein
MNTRYPKLALVLFALSLLLLSFGCETIAGIEERTLAVDEQAELCTEYCDLVMAGCEGEFAVYYRHDACMAVCRTMDIGDLDEAGMTDTLACRLFHANFTDTDPTECVVAGPSGGGVCGDECETYCKFYERVCHPEGSLNPPACVEKCRGLRTARAFDVEAQGSGDTLECRIIHTCNATQNPDVHCPHATLIPPSVGGPCSDTIPPTCEDFCKLTDTACVNDFAVYDSPRQCELACAVFALGDSTNNGTNAAGVTENTIGCRKYHAYVALATPDFHCPHASPTGSAHCGGDAGSASPTASSRPARARRSSASVTATRRRVKPIARPWSAPSRPTSRTPRIAYRRWGAATTYRAEFSTPCGRSRITKRVPRPSARRLALIERPTLRGHCGML